MDTFQATIDQLTDKQAELIGKGDDMVSALGASSADD